MDPSVRRALRELAFVVKGWLPAFLDAPGGGLYDTFDEDLHRLAGVAPALIARELAEKLIGEVGLEVADERIRTQARAELAGRDPGAAELLDAVLNEPEHFVAAIIDALDGYWKAGFDREWARLEPLLHDKIAEAGERIAREGVFSMLLELIPSVRVDRRARTVALDMPHDHAVSVRDRDGIRLAPSHYAWPHVRISCDEPWPLQLTYPVAPLTPGGWRAPAVEELVDPLRALAAQARMEMLMFIAEEPRSTQELSGLLGLTPATVSRHLGILSDAGFITSARSGYYVLYNTVPGRLDEVCAGISRLARGAVDVSDG